MAIPTSWASISALPCDLMSSSTRWASRARSSSLTGRPWQALRTPTRTLPRLNGSVTPLRLTTERLAVSTVVKRRLQAWHWRRRRIAVPSSAVRLSMTRLSLWRQKGQCMACPCPSCCGGTSRVRGNAVCLLCAYAVCPVCGTVWWLLTDPCATTWGQPVDDLGSLVDHVGDDLWITLVAL